MYSNEINVQLSLPDLKVNGFHVLSVSIRLSQTQIAHAFQYLANSNIDLKSFKALVVKKNDN